jgi:hypothetical protein
MGRANARPMTGFAKRSARTQRLECFVALLLPMTTLFNSLQQKWPGIAPGHFIWRMLHLTSAVRCQAAGEAAMPFRR